MNKKRFVPLRLVPKQGRIHARLISRDWFPALDLYHRVLSARWRWLIFWIASLYLATNALFAWLFLLGGDTLENAQEGSFSDAFFFSVQTLSTIGYGGMSPKTPYAHFLVTVESFVGLLGMAIGTGLVFARFSRPTSKVAFSKNLVVQTRNGVPCLMFRVSNTRGNDIVEARVNLSIMRDDYTQEGEHLRRFYELKMERASTPMFNLTWTLIHVIDEESPLFGLSEDNISEKAANFVVVLLGMDDTFSQTVHARYVYTPEDVLFGFRFVDMLEDNERGEIVVHQDRLNMVEPMLEGRT